MSPHLWTLISLKNIKLFFILLILLQRKVYQNSRLFVILLILLQHKVYQNIKLFLILLQYILCFIDEKIDFVILLMNKYYYSVRSIKRSGYFYLINIIRLYGRLQRSHDNVLVLCCKRVSFVNVLLKYTYSTKLSLYQCTTSVNLLD